MTNNDLVIERLNVDVYAEVYNKPNELLQRITEQIKAVVLPLVEEQVDAKLGEATDLDLELEQVRVDLNIDEVIGSQEEIAAAIAQAVRKAADQCKAEQDEFNKLVRINEKTSLVEFDQPYVKAIQDYILPISLQKATIVLNLVQSFFRVQAGKSAIIKQTHKDVQSGSTLEFFDKVKNLESSEISNGNHAVIIQLLHFLKFGYFSQSNFTPLKDDEAVETPFASFSTDSLERNIENKTTLNESYSKLEEIEHYFFISEEKEQLFFCFATFLIENPKLFPRFSRQFTNQFQSELWFVFLNKKFTNFVDLVDKKPSLRVDFLHFLVENPKLISQFLNQATLWSLFMPIDMAQIFMHLLQKMHGNVRNIEFIIKNLLKNVKKGVEITITVFVEITKSAKVEIEQLIDQKSFKNEINHELLTDISHKLMKSAKNENKIPITETIRKHTTNSVFAYIDYLRSDFALAEKIDPILDNYFQQKHQIQTVESWIKSFANFLVSPDIIAAILFELEELKPTNGHRLQAVSYKAKEALLVALLEDRLVAINATISSQVREGFNESESTEQKSIATENDLVHQIAQKERIEIVNAGMVLLNPFLPILFKNLELQNEKGEWLSEQHQVHAIYLLNYLVTGAWEATEDQLYLAKVLTNYPLKEILPAFDLTEKGPWDESNQTQLTAELNNIIEVIQENWRPMRNCTWSGLRTDFLTRAGQLELKENMQYILTIEPHTLDVLLPHIKWGMAMIKYSWMEQILNVEWGE